MDIYFVVAEIHGSVGQTDRTIRKKAGKYWDILCLMCRMKLYLQQMRSLQDWCGGITVLGSGRREGSSYQYLSFDQASVGARLDRTCPFFRIADMYVGETTCDGKKKAWEILAEDVPVHVMDLPQMKREKDVCSWADEIREFKKVVEDFTGNKITAEKLADSIHMINQKRKALERLYAFRRNDRLPISGKDVLLISQIAFYDDPTRFTEMTNKLCDELENRVAEGVSVFPEGTKRIMLTGTPLAIPNWKIHNLVETSGGAVVCEEMCTGTRYFERLVDETKTTVDEQIELLQKDIWESTVHVLHQTAQELMILSAWQKNIKWMELLM